MYGYTKDSHPSSSRCNEGTPASFQGHAEGALNGIPAASRPILVQHGGWTLAQICSVRLEPWNSCLLGMDAPNSCGTSRLCQQTQMRPPDRSVCLLQRYSL
eukprot:scaffold1486_cov329-Prasinococcus_capsulatus_cf.AAC.16